MRGVEVTLSLALRCSRQKLGSFLTGTLVNDKGDWGILQNRRFLHQDIRYYSRVWLDLFGLVVLPSRKRLV